MKRHKNLTLCKPENTSLFRATAFNIKKRNGILRQLYERVLKSWKFAADRVFNIDEIGISTVVQSPNIVAHIGTKRNRQAVFGEQGTLITVCMIYNSVGNTTPPVLIYPRARLYDSLMLGAPPGSLGLVNSPQSSRFFW
jgi:hypothetical protein